jgi:hypothetical protein
VNGNPAHPISITLDSMEITRIFRSRSLRFPGNAIATAFILGLYCVARAQLVALDPSEAGPDYAVQGEYDGKARTQAGAEIGLGAQVVAQGDGQYRVVFYPGGLPGAGWTGSDRSQSDGAPDSAALDSNRVRIMGEAYQGVLSGDSLKGTDGEGRTFVLRKRERQSPTLGLAPPSGAAVLIGAGALTAGSLTEWDNASVDTNGHFAPLEPVATTRKTFTDFSMHMEFRLPFMPFSRGQARGNSGLKFLLPKAFFAEIQILDSFGNEPETDECGGIEVMFKPDVNASLPPLVWQTFDIQLVTPAATDSPTVGKAIMNVWHNGILIHSGRVLPSMGSSVDIALQKYVSPVAFRNMWILEGNDHYAFFPGASIRSLNRTRASKSPLESRSDRSMRSLHSVRLRGPKGLYAPDGSRIPGGK